MKVILINRRHGGSRTVELGRWSRALLSLCCLGLPLGMLALGYSLGQDSVPRSVSGASLALMRRVSHTARSRLISMTPPPGYFE